MARDEQIKAERKRLDAAIRRQEILRAMREVQAAFPAAYRSIVDPNRLDAAAEKRLHDAAKRLFKAMER